MLLCAACEQMYAGNIHRCLHMCFYHTVLVQLTYMSTIELTHTVTPVTV